MSFEGFPPSSEEFELLSVDDKVSSFEFLRFPASLAEDSRYGKQCLHARVALVVSASADVRGWVARQRGLSPWNVVSEFTTLGLPPL